MQADALSGQITLSHVRVWAKPPKVKVWASQPPENDKDFLVMQTAIGVYCTSMLGSDHTWAISANQAGRLDPKWAQERRLYRTLLAGKYIKIIILDMFIFMIFRFRQPVPFSCPKSLWPIPFSRPYLSPAPRIREELYPCQPAPGFTTLLGSKEQIYH